MQFRKQIFTIIVSLLHFSAFAAGIDTTARLLDATVPVDTYCATNAFANGLRDNAHLIDENDSETNVKMWVYDVFQSPDVLTEVLTCPEIIDAADTDTIRFMPIQYTFPNGRELTINYETQPKVLEQRFMLASKTELPTDDINPAVSSADPHATWVNTDPAWYAVMVVQSGALDDFVGPDKNNTISMAHIEQNIDKFYPRDMDGVCSTRAGMGAKINNSMVHNVVRNKTAKHDGDRNNYYVAGDINLKWIAFGEIALEIALNLSTIGGWAVATGLIKNTRLIRISEKIGKNMRALLRADNVKTYVKNSARIHSATRNIENMDKFASSFKQVANLQERLATATKGSKQYNRLEKQLATARNLHTKNAIKIGKDADNIKTLKDLDKLEELKKLRNQEIATLQNAMSDLAKTDKNVAEYIRQSDALRDISKYARELKSIKKARTGNVFQRSWQGIKNTGASFRAANRGGKVLDRAEKVARSGAKFVDKIGDFSQISKNAAKLEKDLVKSADKYHDVARSLENMGQSHIDEITKLTREHQKALSHVDAQELHKLLQSEQDALTAFRQSHQELETAEKFMMEYGETFVKEAKIRHAANAKKLVAAMEKVSTVVGRWGRTTENMGAAFRHSMGASATRDWLFHSTLRNGARITKAAEGVGILHLALRLIGDFFDYTNTSTDKYTNGIGMKPFLLLSADSIEGEDTEVNYGMWLMWAGDAGFAEDDDAAYLQAMDFAQKFHQDLTETQEEQGRYPCDVDIYVVRPIIRNPDTDHQALYWLIMNDVPWSTAR